MPISVACPSCAAKLRAPDAAKGRKLNCPKCGAVVLVSDVPGASGWAAHRESRRQTFGSPSQPQPASPPLPQDSRPASGAPEPIAPYFVAVGIAGLLVLALYAYFQMTNKHAPTTASPVAARPFPSPVPMPATQTPPARLPGTGPAAAQGKPATADSDKVTPQEAEAARRQRILDGKEDGEVTVRDGTDNEVLAEVGSYRNGKKQGCWATFRADGTIEIQDYFNGSRQGYSVFFDSNKRPSSMAEWNDNKRHGYEWILPKTAWKNDVDREGCWIENAYGRLVGSPPYNTHLGPPPDYVKQRLEDAIERHKEVATTKSRAYGMEGKKPRENDRR